MKIIVSILLLFGVATAYQDYSSLRESMVADQIKKRGIKDPATLAAMQKVPRHLFVPKEEIQNAYEDRPIPIGYGQTISQPYIVGYMTEILKLKPGDRVLEVGTGSGYQAAILSEIVSEVFTIEIIEALGNQALKRLGDLKYDNVKVKIGDGYYGWAEHAPYDAIIVTAATEFIPPPLLEQLKEGGRMIIPVGSPFLVQQLTLVEKLKGGKMRTTSVMPVRFVPFKRN